MKATRYKKHRSVHKIFASWLTWLCLLLLILFASTYWVRAEDPKPKPQKWEIQGIVAAFADPYVGVQAEAARQLTEYQLDKPEVLIEDYEEVVQKLVQLLSDSDSDVRWAAVEALEKLGPLEMKDVFPLLSRINDARSELEELRFLAHFVGGGDEEMETLLTWIGKPQSRPTELSRAEGIKTLEVFEQAWQPSASTPSVQKDLAEQIANVVKHKQVGWKMGDIVLLQHHYANLKDDYPVQANAVEDVILSLEGWKWIFAARNIILIHIAFWLALIFVYPQSPQIQAIFFWNPWVRRITGLGYVGFLLTWVPFLRRKLFAPFQPSLLADARLENFTPQAYFPNSEVTRKGQKHSYPIRTAIPEIKGQIILEGDSGLGKSMFLRHLVKTSRRIVVYLPAWKCTSGVIEAIQLKLHGQATDPNFLRNLIYSGALDICIDGLNEVNADTRAEISKFVERYFKGNIIMATQPLEWIPPSTTKTYILQPLKPEQIKQFLLSRQATLPQDAILQGEEYKKACDSYLKEAFRPSQSPEELEDVQRILSNPMDLTVVAQMIANGKKPDLLRLQEQQYTLMAADYQRLHLDQEFPLDDFSEAVYQMRLHDELALPEEKFSEALLSMERHKMVVSRQIKDENDNWQKEWFFRHDKIMEFFIVQTFLGADNDRSLKHISDARFRGVYFLLATLLPFKEALSLRERLIQYAADTKDHTVSDKFIQLLRSRQAIN